MDIRYTITFFSVWHCGSGLSAGADVDMLVIKDEDGLPFVPGKTVKGLLREAVEDYVELTKSSSAEKVNEVFGCFDLEEKASFGTAFFSDAVISTESSEDIKKYDLKSFLYKRLSATAISENGIAKAHSLRRIEVVVPCMLHGEIIDVPNDFVDVLKKSMGMIKRLGSWRNRGLGRCTIKPLN